MSENPQSSINSKFTAQLESFGITPSVIHRNLPVAKLVDLAVQKNEGIVTSTGSISVKTGKYTGRSPEDRFIVYDDTTHDTIDWGKINHQGSVQYIFQYLQK